MINKCVQTITKRINDEHILKATMTESKTKTVDYFYEIKLNEARQMAVVSAFYSEEFLKGFFNYYEKIITELVNKQYYLEKISEMNNPYNVSQYANTAGKDDIIKPRLMLTNSIHINYLTTRPLMAENFIEQHKNDKFTLEMIVEYLLYYNEKAYNNNSEQAKIDAIEHCKKYPKNKDYFISDDFYDAIVYCDPILNVLSKDKIKYLSLRYTRATSIILTENRELIDIFYKTFILSYDVQQFTMNLDQKIKHFNSNNLIMPDNITNDEIKEHNFFKDCLNTSYITKNEHKVLKKLVDYVNNLTVKEYIQMINIMKKELNSDIIIMPFAELLLFCNNSAKNEPKDIDFVNFVSYSLVHSHIYKTKYSWIIKEDRKYSGKIIARLQKIMKNEDIIKLLADTTEMNNALTQEQWLDYIDNFDEYNKMPVSWWIELI